MVAAGALASVTTADTDIFSALELACNDSKDWLFGFVTYDLLHETEPGILKPNPSHHDGIKFPDACFFFPEHLVRLCQNELIIESVGHPKKIYEDILNTAISNDFHTVPYAVKQRCNRVEYLQKVKQVQQHILNGDLYEVNLCQEFYVENYEADAILLFERLNNSNPAPFATFLRYNGHYLLCASPERFMRKKGRRIISQPMKGTRLRTFTENEQTQRAALFADPKERAENVMIVDLVRNDLARSAIAGSVTVDELYGVYTFPTVHQMVSTVSATIRPDLHFITAIKNAFPMGSMTGAPKVKAMQLINEYEKTRRGLFSGTAGFITPEGDFDFNVVIRSFLYNSDLKYLSFQTGSAITHDSVPEKEYEECILKASALIKALQ